MKTQPQDVSQLRLDQELNQNPPYNIQNIRSVDERETNTRRDAGPHFQPLCETYRRTIKLDNMFYDYRPNHFDEIYCVYPFSDDENNDSNVSKD